jgi:hypothetical protein
LDKAHGNTNLAQSIAAKREKPTAGKDDGLSVSSSRGNRTAIELFLAEIHRWESVIEVPIRVTVVIARPRYAP